MALSKVLRRVGLTSVVMIAMVIAGCVSSSEKVPELPTAGNLLENAGFEQLEDGWAQRWQISSDTDEAKATVSPEAARTGDYGILMKDAVGDEVLTVQQSIKDIRADQQYEMTAWVKTTSPVGALRMSVRFYNAGAQ